VLTTAARWSVELPTAGRWPALPDDAELWVPAPPAFSTERLRRLDAEQRGG
jgi:hypothetical protein